MLRKVVVSKRNYCPISSRFVFLNKSTVLLSAITLTGYLIPCALIIPIINLINLRMKL